jgi:ketosteroid isomerase-like protein
MYGSGMGPADLHSAVQAAYNNADVEALVSLYEADAWLFGPEGPVQGLDAIRALWTGFVAMEGQIEMVTQYAIEHGDVAMLSNRWTMTIGGETISASTAELARRQPDGTWKYVIDNPDAAGLLAG